MMYLIVTHLEEECSSWIGVGAKKNHSVANARHCLRETDRRALGGAHHSTRALVAVN